MSKWVYVIVEGDRAMNLLSQYLYGSGLTYLIVTEIISGPVEIRLYNFRIDGNEKLTPEYLAKRLPKLLPRQELMKYCELRGEES